MLPGLLIIPRTISTNPLARLFSIDCWRSIVFLIIWNLERKGTGFKSKFASIIICLGHETAKNKGMACRLYILTKAVLLLFESYLAGKAGLAVAIL